MSSIISLVMSLILKVAPGATTEIIAQIVPILVQLVPILVQEYKDLLPVVQNIIAALKDNSEITQEQWDALDALNQQYDAEFLAALQAAKAEDAELDAADAAAAVAKPAT